MSAPKSNIDVSKTGIQTVNESKDVPWFLKTISPRLMTPILTSLLKDYSSIPIDQQEEHLYKIRDLAWDVFPFPCIGLWWWLVLGLSTHPHYPSLLSHLKEPDSSSPKKFLDLGTCLGQDLRKLAYDGVAVESLYGSDLFLAYEGVGYVLFYDVDKFRGHFIAGDIFDISDESPLMKTAGTWNVININMFLHQFSWDDQIIACKQILKLLSPKAGSFIMGAQLANTESGDEILRAPFFKEGFEKKVFRHSKESFERMWREVAGSEGVDVDVWAEYQDRTELGSKEDESRHTAKTTFFANEAASQRRLYFLIKRL